MSARVELKPHVICDVHGSDIVATDAELAAELVRQHNEHDHPPTLVEVIRNTYKAHDLNDSATACCCGMYADPAAARALFPGHLIGAIAKAIEARFTVVAR